MGVVVATSFMLKVSQAEDETRPMMPINPEEGERIARFLDLRTRLPQHADCVFVFGTHHPDPAYIAVDLLNRGIASRVILTGGKNRLTGENEADQHLRILLQDGIPRDNIVVEGESTNTQENVVFALREIAKCRDLNGMRSLIAVAKWYHCRRGIMTLKRYMPEGARYFATTYEVDGVTRAGWWLTEEGRKRVMKEQQLISESLARGEIAEVRKDDGVLV
jgi:uncharacterized SAM-binding protein YcdF (DUF218 family)